MMAGRSKAIESYRGIAIIGVLVIHVFSVIMESSDMTVLIGRQLVNYAVALFVFISGYLYATSSWPESWAAYGLFLRKKLLRILIPYFL